MAKARRGRIKAGLAIERLGEPTREQIEAFARDGVMHFETSTTKVAYRRLPVIDRLHTAGVLSDDEYSNLAFYKDQAELADRSPVRSCCDNSVRGGDQGPGVAILSAQITTGRLERDMGHLWRIARAIAVENMTLDAWCIQQHGGRERYDAKGAFVAIVPNDEKRVMKLARIDLRAAAHRITR